MTKSSTKSLIIIHCDNEQEKFEIQTLRVKRSSMHVHNGRYIRESYSWLRSHAPVITSWKGWVYHRSTVSNSICVILSLGNDTKSSSRPAICSARLGVPTALSTSVRSECRNVAPTKKITRLSALLDHRLDAACTEHALTVL